MPTRTRTKARQETLIASQMALVDAVARQIVRRLPPCFELADLRGAGYLGLIDAARKFQPSRGVPFRAYARQRIRGAILDSFRRRRYLDQTSDPIERVDACTTNAGLDEAVDQCQMSKLVCIAVAELPAREARVIRRYYGKQDTLGKIGRELGVGASRASQIHREALGHLRATLGVLGVRAA